MIGQPFRPTDPPPALYEALGAEGLGHIFSLRQHQACERVEHYVLHLALRTLADVGTLPPCDAPACIDELVRRAGVVPAFRARLDWLLDLLVDTGALARRGGTHVACVAPDAFDVAALRAEALARDADYEPTYDLLDAAAALYPTVARGETAAEPALLRRPRLWVRYFSNANPYYALGNAIPARAVARRAPTDATVIEVGGGPGSSAQAVLDELARAGRSPRRYVLTDPVPFFRRHAERAVTPPGSCELVTAALDMNAPWDAQGVPAESADVVLGVNAFHLAHDLPEVLASAWHALRPGGLLVIGEGLRRHAGRPEPAEFPFQLLESFHAVRLDPALRSRPGFVHPVELGRALEQAGFTEVVVVPDLGRIRRYYAGFLGGALCARRPRSPSTPSAPR